MTENQKCSPFISQSFPVIHSKRSFYSKFDSPISIALTPYPRGNIEVPTLPYPLKQAPRCRVCGSFACKACSLDNSRPIWFCSICGSPNLFRQKVIEKGVENEMDSLIFDVISPMSDEYSDNLPPLFHSQTMLLLVIELSHMTFDCGLYIQLLERIKSMSANINTAKISAFILADNITFPIVNHQTATFRLCTSTECESFAFPPIDSLCFNLERERDTFIQFIDSLKKMAPRGHLADFSAFSIGLFEFASPECVPVVFIVSDAFSVDSHRLAQKGLEKCGTGTTFDYFILRSGSFIFNPPTEFCILCNGIARFFGRSEIGLMVRDSLSRLTNGRYSEVVITAIVPSNLKITDIQGCGIRKSSNTFVLSTMSLGDSVYFSFDYDKNQIPIRRTSIQFIAQGLDGKFNRFFRIVTSVMSVDDDDSRVFSKFNSYVATSVWLMRCIDEWRENGASKPLREFVDNKVKRLPTEKEDDLRPMQSILCEESAGMVYGRHPADVFKLFLLMCREIRKSGEISEPFQLSKLPSSGSGILIEFPGEIGLLLIGDGENEEEWKMIAQNELGAKYAGWYIEIGKPSSSRDNQLVEIAKMYISGMTRV